MKSSLQQVPLLLLLGLPAALSAPEQIHVASAGDDGMAVSFFSSTACALPTVSVTLPDGSKVSSKAEGLTYLDDAGYHYHAVFNGLSPQTTYPYTVYDSDSTGCGVYSGELSFRTPPASDVRSLHFAVFGDLGTREHRGAATIDYLGSLVNAEEDPISLIWHAGDVGYADDSFLHEDCVLNFCYEGVWNDYMNQMQDAGVATVPYMVTSGNHEADCHDPACLTSKVYRDQLSNFSAYNTRFRMPSEETGGVMNMHYSFNQGPVHFLTLDLETGFPGAAEETRYVLPCGGFGDQLAWIEADLAAANASRAERPWIFVAGHHPMYHEDTSDASMQAALEDLFHTYGVDMMFTGHVHSYERDYPVYNNVVTSTSYVNNPDTVHIMVGGAGNDEMRDSQRRKLVETNFGVVDLNPSEERDAKAYQTVEGAAWTAFTDKGYYGIGVVHVHNDTHVHFEYVRTTEQAVTDEIWVVKDRS